MDTYQTITDSIIDAIEKGAGKYEMPWKVLGNVKTSPINASSRNAYRGINTLVLGGAAMEAGYQSGEWATYKQWQDAGAQVRKGEKSTAIVFWKFLEIGRETEDGETESKTLPMIRLYRVFNAQQVEGYTAPELPEVQPEPRIAECERFVSALGATVNHGGNRAFYSLVSDSVNMPTFNQFNRPESYYSVLAHELTHWTGHSARCNREFGKRFGDMAYAAEELVAELGAAFTCSKLGVEIDPRTDHAPYISSWLKVLRSDSRAIFTAASKAQAAADWMIAQSSPAEQSQVA